LTIDDPRENEKHYYEHEDKKAREINDPLDDAPPLHLNTILLRWMPGRSGKLFTVFMYASNTRPTFPDFSLLSAHCLLLTDHRSPITKHGSLYLPILLS
jgi:hypothetical protein